MFYLKRVKYGRLGIIPEHDPYMTSSERLFRVSDILAKTLHIETMVSQLSLPSSTVYMIFSAWLLV